MIFKTELNGPAKITLFYAVLAASWILLSDQIITVFVQDPTTISIISTIKGWGFVALTSFILYGLMKRMIANNTAMHLIVVMEQTKKLQALNLLQLISDMSTDAIFVKDMAGRYVLCNPETGRFVGKNRAEIIGLDDRAIFLPQDAEKTMEMDRQIMERGEVCTFEEVISTPKKMTTFLSTKGPIYDENNTLIGLFGISRDITERKQVENATREKNKKLIQYNQDLEQFAYIASHDLRTPLQNIIHFAQLLERRYKGQLDADADEFIGFIVDGGKQMTSLIDDLLEYSNISSQSKPLEPTLASKAASQALSNLNLRVGDDTVKIFVGDLPEVMAEHNLLVSLFQNLLDNCLKYSAPDRKAEISISAEKIDIGLWTFIVADNGIGIEPQYFDKVFEIFQRLAPAQTAEGTGIGLTLCRRIVHRFGGSIWMDSIPGAGTKIYFTLENGAAADCSQNPTAL